MMRIGHEAIYRSLYIQGRGFASGTDRLSALGPSATCRANELVVAANPLSATPS